MEDASSSAMDAYSQVVTTVAATVGPSVAALQVRRGSGSAVVFTADGFLLTNAHVVGRTDAGRLAFADGTSTPFHVIGADPLSDLAVLRADGPTPAPARLGEASDLRVGQCLDALRVFGLDLGPARGVVGRFAELQAQLGDRAVDRG